MTSKTTTTAESAFLDTWMRGGSKPSRYVTLYAANGLQAEIDYIDQQLADMEAAAAGRMGGAAGTAGLEKRRAELQNQLAESSAVFKVQSVSSKVTDEIAVRLPIGDDVTTEHRGQIVLRRWLEQVAAQIVAVGPTKEDIEPVKFTPAQVEALKDSVGDAEYDKLLAKCLECMSEVSASRPTWHGGFGSGRS